MSARDSIGIQCGGVAEALNVDAQAGPQTYGARSVRAGATDQGATDG